MGHIIYIRTVSSLLLITFGKFNSFLFLKVVGMGRHQVFSACCSAQTPHKPWFRTAQKSRQQALRTYCSKLYTVLWGQQKML